MVRVQQADDPLGPAFQIRMHDVREALLRQRVVLQQRVHVLVQRFGLGVQGGAGGALGQGVRGLRQPLVLVLGGLPQKLLRPLHDLPCRGFGPPVSPVSRGFHEQHAFPRDEGARIPHDGEAGFEALDALLSRFQALHVAVHGPPDGGRQVGHRILAVVDHPDVGSYPVGELGEHVEVAVDTVLDLADLDAPLRRQHLRRADGFHRAHVLCRHRLVALDLDPEEPPGGQKDEAHQDAQSHLQQALHG